ncbi:hypothetical protein STEG23_032219, partial [Scotinomys teguina]
NPITTQSINALNTFSIIRKPIPPFNPQLTEALGMELASPGFCCYLIWITELLIPPLTLPNRRQLKLESSNKMLRKVTYTIRTQDRLPKNDTTHNGLGPPTSISMRDLALEGERMGEQVLIISLSSLMVLSRTPETVCFSEKAPQCCVLSVPLAAGNSNTRSGIASKYQVDPDACFSAKVNNSGLMGLGYTQTLKPGIKLTLSALLDGKNVNVGTVKANLSLSFSCKVLKAKKFNVKLTDSKPFPDVCMAKGIISND